jgi:hypothetical protein
MLFLITGRETTNECFGEKRNKKHKKTEQD